MDSSQNEASTPRIRVACCQYAPKLRAYEENVQKVEALMSNLHSDDVDLLIFPELTFVGYMFKDKADISRFVEDAETGRTVTWAREVAVRLHTYVIIGFPRVVRGEYGDEDKYYNSLSFIDNQGRILKTYDKTFLYEVDESWATEGAGFVTVDTADFGRVGLGICMDINPRRFEAPFEAFEWATFNKQHGSNILVLICAWRDNEVDQPDSRRVPNYWATRLQPLIGLPVTALICDRVGTEEDVTFTGCTCCISLKEPILLGQLNKRQENILLMEISKPANEPNWKTKLEDGGELLPP